MSEAERTAAINRLWELIEPSIAGYSRALQMLMERLSDAELRSLVAELEAGETEHEEGDENT